MIPILPLSKIDVLDAPFPYIIGVQPHPLIDSLGYGSTDMYETEFDGLKVDLDKSLIFATGL